MATVTIYDPDSVVSVVNGPPPVDQSAEVAALTAQVATLTSQIATLNQKIATALVDAQKTVADLS